MRLSIALGVITAVNITLSLLIQWYLITTLGAGLQTDALIAGMALPQLMLVIGSGSLGHVLVPLLTTTDAEGFSQEAWTFLSAVTALFTLIALILAIAAPVWVPLLVPGFSPAGWQLAVQLTRIQLIGMVATAGCSVLWAVQQARRRFVWSEIAPLIANLLGVAFLIWALPRFGAVGAAWGMVLRAILQLLFLLPGIGRYQRPRRTEALREAWSRLAPLLAGTAYYKADLLLDRLLASMTSAGGLSLLYIAQQIHGAATQVASRAIAGPITPVLATSAAAHDWEGFRRTYRHRLASMAGLMASGFVILLVAGKPLLTLLIGHGGITSENIHQLWLLMLALIGVPAAGGLGQISSQAFYAMGDTQTPTKLGVWTYTAFIPLKIAAFAQFGLVGLGTSISLFIFVNLVLQLFYLERNTAKETRASYAA